MVLVLVLFVCGESKELEDTGTKPKGFVLLKHSQDVAEKMGRAPWFQLGALPIFVSKLFGGVSGQHGNHCCYAPAYSSLSVCLCVRHSVWLTG